MVRLVTGTLFSSLNLFVMSFKEFLRPVFTMRSSLRYSRDFTESGRPLLDLFKTEPVSTNLEMASILTVTYSSFSERWPPTTMLSSFSSSISISSPVVRLDS